VKPPAGLRARITLLVAGVVVVCVVIAFGEVYRGTSSELTSRIDHDVREDMGTLEQAVTSGPGDPAAVVARARRFLRSQPFRATNHVVFVQAPGRPTVTNQPELLHLGPDSDREPASDTAAERRSARDFLSSRPGLTVRELPDAGRVRLLVREVSRQGRTIARLGVGEPTASRDRADAVVRKAFLLAGTLALLAALAGAFLVASRVVAPLRRMAGVAARVDEGDLGPRMNVHGRRDEIMVLAESFDHMLDRLQGAFDRQGAFVADASHELRTPLTVVRGQLEVLALQPEPSAEEVRRVEAVVRTEVDRMGRLVDDLLLLAQADESHFLRRGRIELPAFLAELLGSIGTTSDRRFVLGPVPAVAIEADADRLAQAVRNLLSNAISHTAAGGLVRLEAARADETVRVIVDDSGAGIPVEQRDQIFERFQRLDSGRARKDGGAGLGLAIVHAIAEAHGGRVWAEQSPEGGARLVLELPLLRAARASPG
jgi:two-component system, OmpR family, sensor kinase